MADTQCPCYGNTNDWKCSLTKPPGVPPPYVPAGTRPGWINTKGLVQKVIVECRNSAMHSVIKFQISSSFVMEWYDRGADFKKYTLTYYGIDKSCEITDLVNHRRFLRRLKVDTVTLENLIVGNVINIYGREMTVTEYADSCTKQFLEPKQERTFLLVRPHAVQCLGQIYEILARNFRILRCRMAWFTEEAAKAFYQQYSAESFFKTHSPCNICSCGRICTCCENAIQRLMELAGDIDPGKAKLKNAMSLRAVYGQNIVFGGVDISESPECVVRDTAFFFTDCRLMLPRMAPVAMIGKCSSLGIIKLMLCE
ncbi:Nucleoside diphosphate kinase 7 [Orchesella cincta]|uniref:Nucleoside diphosphate kinase 7 n=1 Tax=Orchesella cincta TaxID=48709 RepID=A0A1D2M2S9_ORCCI|nr:Nucleoside diphosphate kinase 7 [Orchesella cincta]